MWLDKSLKLATVIAYFLPFVFFVPSCDGAFNLNYSYNQKEAEKNLAIQDKYYETNNTDTEEKSSGYSKDTVREAIDATAFSSSADVHQKNERLIINHDKWKRLIRAILMPTETSLSGIGTLFYFKNDFGKALMATSIFLMLLYFFPFKNRLYKIPVFILSGNLICIAAFIINCIICDVDTLVGLWVLLTLLLSQIIVNIKTTNQYRSALTA